MLIQVYSHNLNLYSPQDLLHSTECRSNDDGVAGVHEAPMQLQPLSVLLGPSLVAMRTVMGKPEAETERLGVREKSQVAQLTLQAANVPT